MDVRKVFKQLGRDVAKFLLRDVTILRVQLGWLAVVFAFGLLFANTANGAYTLMLRHHTVGTWATALLVYGGFRIFSLCVRLDNRLISYLISALGLYLWTFTLLSFIDNPLRPFGAADTMISMLILCEVWVGASNIQQHSRRH